MKKSTFWLLSLTWGLPMTLIGALAAAVLMICGHKPKRHGYCYYFEVGYGWGGVELGGFFIVQHRAMDYLKSHEFGHGLQNCYYGFLMPFIVCIPSAVRYWYRRLRSYLGKPPTTGYYDIWFEAQASKWGVLKIQELRAVETDGGK